MKKIVTKKCCQDSFFIKKICIYRESSLMWFLGLGKTRGKIK